jgi:ParB family transcriptional regulator, chromosome partitioning protein
MRHPAVTATKRSTEQKAESIRCQGVLSSLLVRPLTDQTFEIAAGARRYRAAQIAEATIVPVRIVNLTDAEALEAHLIDNLQRRYVHPKARFGIDRVGN